MKNIFGLFGDGARVEGQKVFACFCLPWGLYDYLGSGFWKIFGHGHELK